MAGRNTSVLILYRADYKILLQHRTKDAPTYPDYWCFFGGGIRKASLPNRLSKENASKNSDMNSLAHACLWFSHLSKKRANARCMYSWKNITGRPLTLGEGQGMDWFLPAETVKLLMNDHDRSVLRAVGTFLQVRLGDQNNPNVEGNNWSNSGKLVGDVKRMQPRIGQSAAKRLRLGGRTDPIYKVT